jgi:hypothetical protein
MTNLIKIHNLETGEEIEREMNAEEFAEFEANKADLIARQTAGAKKEADKTALLEKLGITEDEARLLLG